MENKAQSFVVTGGWGESAKPSWNVWWPTGLLWCSTASRRRLSTAQTSIPDVHVVLGDADNEADGFRAASTAEAMAPLVGWVNNAAAFTDPSLLAESAEDVMGLITANLGMAVVGCRVAASHLREHRRPGAIVNVSSHQGRRPAVVRFPMPLRRRPSKA